MSPSRKVLCVFSEEHEALIRPSLEAVRPPDLELFWRNDGEAALGEVTTLQPALVVVGMDLGPMEGIEFLALFMRAQPESTIPIMVAPSPGDPFPAVVHRRDKASGRSEAAELERGDLPSRILEVLDQCSTPPASPAVAVAAPSPAAKEEHPIHAELTPVTFIEATASSVTARRSSSMLLVGLLGVLAAGAGIAGYLLWPSAKPTAGSGMSAPDARPLQSMARPTPPPVTPDAAPTSAAPTSAAPSTASLPAEQVLPLSFRLGSGQPKIEDEGALTRVAVALRAASAGRWEIGGHTSNEGSDELNQRLGLARAQAAVRLLIARGISAARLRAVSHGGSKPIASDDTEEGRAKNRRVTLRRLP